jgi:hypothetical protein
MSVLYLGLEMRNEKVAIRVSSAISFDFEEMNEQFDLNDLRSEGQCHQHILGEVYFGGPERVSDHKTFKIFSCWESVR